MSEIIYKQKIQNKSLKIGIIGLGYVGLPLAMTYAKKGFLVYGYDIDENKVNSLLKKKNYILDVDNQILVNTINDKVFCPTNDQKDLKKCDVIFVCVPTPITKNKVPNVSYIENATNIIMSNFKNGSMVILKSTTYPGTTEEIILSAFEKNNMIIDKDFYLAFSPERIDPGNEIWNSDNTPIVVGGVSKKSGDIAEIVIKSVISKVYKASSAKIAEMEKLLENIFRSVNIALVNEMAQMCDRMGDINIWEVIEAAATKPFGYMPFKPGPGIGGHCILIDPYYLSYCAKGYGFHSEFIELAAKTNENMPHYVVDEIIKVLIKNCENIYKSKVLFLGVSFKKNVGDIRNSPAIEIIKNLNKIGFSNISYYDEFVPKFQLKNNVYKSLKSLQDISSFDCCIITTDHDNIDYNKVIANSKLTFDTRNVKKNKQYNNKYYLLGDGKK